MPLRLIVDVPPVEELLVMVNSPVAATAVVGSNCTLTVVDCPAFKVTGNVPPDIVKPVPVTVAALTVTGAVPVDVKVTDCVDAVFTVTLPKATLVALILNVGTTAFNCRVKLLVMPPALAVRAADCAVLTDDTVAVKPALIAFAGTVTAAGTTTAESLLDRLTLAPPLGAAALNVTVQASVPDPVIDPLLQENPLNAATAVAATPEPLKLTTAVPLVEELLVMVN